MVRTADLPDLGSVTDGSLFVADRSGSGAFRATALRDYVAATVDDAEVASAANTGRNLLHNARFNMWFRGNGPFANGYCADRWNIGANTDAVSVTAVPASDADRTAIGDEAILNILQDAVTGDAGAASFSYLIQPVEFVQRLSGKTVTFSFWARATSGTPKLGINAMQNFGTGGSPSAVVWALSTGNSVTLSTTWTRYTSTIALPSAVGKTLGSGNNDYTAIALFTSSGSTNNPIAGNIGVQSFTFQLWGAQLEIGSAATALEKIELALDLATCERFFQTGQLGMAAYQAAGSAIFQSQTLRSYMRAVPTITANFTTQTNTTGSTAVAVDAGTLRVSSGNATATGAVVIAGVYAASADL